MKTIEQLAVENRNNELVKGNPNSALFVSRIGLQILLDKTYANGAEEAQRWIPIEEEDPEDGELCFIKFTTISGGFSYGVGIFKLKTKDFHRLQGCKVVAWRPIERK